jgi:hypothetical protein
MGSCCGRKSTVHHGFHHQHKPTEHKHKKHKNKDEEYKLPKIIIISQDSALVYLDVSSTSDSERLRHLLKRKFPNLVECDGEKRVFHLTNMMKEKRFYFVIVGDIREQTLRSMLNNSKIKGIYFALEETDLHHYSKSSKIKGFFDNLNELKQAIYYDIRNDESY